MAATRVIVKRGMDPLLLPYLQAVDESERQAHLDELVLLHAGPAIRRALREKLGFYVNQRGHDPHNQDAEDLYQEAITKIIKVLSDLRDSSGKSDLEDFRLYSWRVAANLCMHFFRNKSPARRRLKDNLRLVLNHHPGFASWKEGGEQLCGFAHWRRNQPPAPALDTRSIDEKLADFQYTHVSDKETIGNSLSRTLRELFECIGAPVEVDTLVNILARVLKVKDPLVVPIDAQTNQQRAAQDLLSSTSRVEEQTLLNGLWAALQRLPVEQRNAFSLSFEDDAGRDLFSLCIGSGIVTVPELARAFNVSVHDIVRLRSQMPMNGAAIALELNASTAQVNKWKWLARQHLKKELLH